VGKTLLVPLSGGTAQARDSVARLIDSGEIVVFPLAHLANGNLHVLRHRRYDRLVVAGSPPAEEIGYAFAPVVALVARTGQVALVDLGRDEAVSEPLLKYLARTVPFALVQFAASTAALIAQRAAIPVAKRASLADPCAAELSKLVYLRPSVGSASPVGGSVTHSHEVIRALGAEGVEVEAFTTDAGIADTAASDPAPPCRWHVARGLRAIRAIPPSAAAGSDTALVRAALRAVRMADVIYQRHARFSLAGALLARLSGKPLFLEYNGSEEFVGRYWNATPLRRRLVACENAALHAAARILVVSHVDRRALVERGVDQERIVVNPNGVDATRFSVGGGAEIRGRHGIDADDVVVGFVGTFGPWHGAPVLARAFAQVSPTLPGLHLLLVGDGPELDVTRRIVRDAGLERRVSMVGPVQPSAVPHYLDACDILVSPHVPLPDGVEFFGSPTKLFEYMAAGKGIIASRLGQIGDVLEHAQTAWLVEPAHVSALGNAIRALSQSAELREQLGARARREAIDHHSWRARARRIVAAYEELAAGAT
jgi:glycosyltransferase involved in cell wall biosynthesis